MSRTYYEYRDAKVKIAHRLFKMDGWKVYGYKEDRSDSMTDYYDPANWDGIAEKNGYILVIDKDWEQKEPDYAEIKTPEQKKIDKETDEKIEKLEQMTQARGASEQEEATAKAKIEALKNKKVESDAMTTEKVLCRPAHKANPPRCNWHIEKDGIILDKGNGLLKFSNVPDITEFGYSWELEAWQEYNNLTPEEWKEKYINDYVWKWGEKERENATNYAETRYNEAKENYALLDKFNNLIARWNNICGGMVSNAGEDGYIYEEITVTKYKKELKPQVCTGEIKEGQCFIVKTGFNYGHCKGYVYRIHENDGSFYAVRLGKGYKKERTGAAACGNYWYMTSDFIKWFERGSLAFCELVEVKTPYEVKKVVKKAVKSEATKAEPQQAEETAPKTETTEPEQTQELETIEESETLTDEEITVSEGMKFIDADNKVFEITKLDSMSIEFNNGERALYDFGTSRTLKAVIDALGNGAKYQNAQTKKGSFTDELCKTTENEKSENADTDSIAENVEESKEEVVAESATTTAPSFEDLARAFVTGKTVKTQKKKEEPKEEPQEQEFTKNGKIGTLHTEKEIKGKKYIIDAADLAENSDTRYEVVIMDENGDFAKEYHTDGRAEARRVFFQYSEMWIPEKESYGYEESSDYFTQEEIETLENGGQVKKDGYRKGESITFFSTPYTLEGARLVYELSTAGHDAHYRGFIVNHKFYNDKEKISEEMKTDINTEVKRLLPTEQDAEKNAGELDDREEESVDFYRNNDFLNDAQKHFYKGTEPELVLYHPYNPFTADECIKYLLNPTEYTQEQAREYIEGYYRVEVLKDYMRYNRTAATLAKIRADKGSETQKLKRIMDSIDKEKSVKVTLSNGNTVKVEADAVKRIGYSGYISSYNVSACDRQYLGRDEYNRGNDIKAEDIKQITHGQRILYKVA